MKVIFDASPFDVLPMPLFNAFRDAVGSLAGNYGVKIELVVADSVHEAAVRWSELVLAKDAAEAGVRKG